ncbi:alpha/beta hydrolase family protein [Eilatimonas milleporae]|uniref:Dipeptidyl aminopeptidase/acylaminoacyl peptidase n=1 Tax=Eilatimonas milleporae TaxID=911205 RepID=A0A3M0CK32_9PROT|nr:prolyl oligopeptidase family serine peptidase [Eilatimonas milleporae]RMB08710.1 dipeptidyl aminopeptidase/acylaminoacyl peptidase [Eilatimonas milleporae]
MRFSVIRLPGILTVFSLVAAFSLAAVFGMAVSADEPAARGLSDDRLVDLAERFGHVPRVFSPSLSPDGTAVAYIESDKDKGFARIMVGVLTAEDVQHVSTIQAPGGETFAWVDWANDERLIVGFDTHFRIGGELYRSAPSKMMAVNRDGSLPVILDIMALRAPRRQRSNDVIHMLPDDPEHILVGHMAGDGRSTGVYTLNIYTGEKTPVSEAPDGLPVFDWYADNTGQIRLGYGENKDGDGHMLIRDGEGEWLRLEDIELLSRDRFSIHGFSDDPNIVYVTASHTTGRSTIFRFDLKRRVLDGKVYGHDSVDVQGLLTSRSGKALAASYFTSRYGLEYLDEGFRMRHLALKEKLGGRDFTVLSSTKGGSLMLVETFGLDEPGRLFFYQAENDVLREWVRNYPALSTSDIGRTVPVTYGARDGVEIPGYITLPPGMKLDEAKGVGLPAIVLPHGGPHVRTLPLFDYEAKFLAALGYVVLQPNFRGSSGYGFRYMALGWGGWGKHMQDDLVDGARWLVHEGYAAANRICIAGGSYGGYASLMASVRDTGTFRCAAAWAPVTDIRMMLEEEDSWDEDSFVYSQLAGYTKKGKIKAYSPLQRIKEVAIPVFVAHGTHDQVVGVGQSRAFAKAAARRKKAVDYAEFEGEGHHLRYSRYRTQWLYRLGAFMSLHNPAVPRPEGR